MQRAIVSGPFEGVVSDIPAPSTPQAFDYVENMFCRKARLQSRPSTGAFAPTTPEAFKNIMSFVDGANFLHTLGLGINQAYMLSGGVWNLLGIDASSSGGITDLSGTSLPYGYVIVNDRVYFSNGSVKLLYCNGGAKLFGSGDAPGACRFLTTNANHLIGGCWTESGVFRPSRIRWSDSGNLDEWDTANPLFSAGLVDVFSTPDLLTGLVTLGVNTYIFRSNGISLMQPTGAIPAFFIQNITFTEHGVGNFYPYSLASYGSQAFFVAEDDIYSFDGSNPQRIAGGKAKQSIFRDLALADMSINPITGCTIPGLGGGYDFLSYWLNIPGLQKSWVYNIEDKNWTAVKWAPGGGNLFDVINLNLVYTS